MYWTMIPIEKATPTDTNIPVIMVTAFSELIYWPRLPNPSPLLTTLYSATATEAPSNSKTMETVVEVGSPNVLKKSSRTTSVNITAKKMTITSAKEKNCGLKIPLRATSIIPPANSAPTNTPKDATIIMVRRVPAFDPIAELRKFTASLATPTMRSIAASTNKIITKNKNILIIITLWSNLPLIYVVNVNSTLTI